MKDLETSLALTARYEKEEVFTFCSDCFNGLLGAVNGSLTGRTGERFDETWSSSENKNVDHHGCYDASDAFAEASR